MRSETGEDRPLAWHGLAELAVAQGNHMRAAKLHGAAEAVREALGMLLVPVDLDRLTRIESSARAALGEAAFSEASGPTGRAMTVEQAVAYALREDAQPRPTSGQIDG